MFVKRHENRIFRTAVAIMGSKADAEDIMQDVFLKAIEKKSLKFESAEHESAWLAKVTVNQCRSLLRSAWRKKREPLLDTYPAKDEEQQNLIETINLLPPKYRIAICLFYYEGYSAKEIAAMINQKESSVRSILTRARKKLKDFLESETE
jgi:RNA polymerase sigma-70 factor (ECF subfamily)